MTAGLRSETRAPAAGRQQRPVVVLAYAYCGAPRIQRLLSGSAVLACTSGTGLLPLCAQAADTWRRVDGRDGPLSPLAVSSVRAMTGSMITVILAGTGKSRWCEISFSPPATAETFLQLYPEAKFVCLHRSCPDVIRAAVEANPWGLAGSGPGQFTAAYPGSSVAAVAAYWAECTELMLGFEQAHPVACRQVRYEDLAGQRGPRGHGGQGGHGGQPDQRAAELFAFLDLDETAVSALTEQEVVGDAETGTTLAAAHLPASHLPPRLTERVNDLQGRLGYPPFAGTNPSTRPAS